MTSHPRLPSAIRRRDIAQQGYTAAVGKGLGPPAEGGVGWGRKWRPRRSFAAREGARSRGGRIHEPGVGDNPGEPEAATGAPFPGKGSLPSWAFAGASPSGTTRHGKYRPGGPKGGLPGRGYGWLNAGARPAVSKSAGTGDLPPPLPGPVRRRPEAARSEPPRPSRRR